MKEIRQAIERVFSADTAVGDYPPGCIPSTGHCAAVAVAVRRLLGGEFVSAIVCGQSHWFNRVLVDGVETDVDLTGDQFGLPPIQTAPAGALYPGSQVRDPSDVNRETATRATMLAHRAGL